MSWKNVLLLIFVLYFSILVALAIFLPKLLKTETVYTRVANISSMLPQGRPTPVQEREWKGYQFPGKLRILFKNSENPTEEYNGLINRTFRKYYLKKRISLFDRGIYIVQKRGKGYNIYSIFCRNHTIYWTDIRSSSSTLDYQKEVFNKFLTNLSIDNEKTGEILKAELEKIDKSISPFVIQTITTLLLFLAAVFGLTLIILYFVFSFSSALPKHLFNRRFDIIYSPNVTFFTGKFKKKNPCCLVREGNELAVYWFKKEIFRLNLRDKQKFTLDKNVIKYEKYKIKIPKPEMEKFGLHARY